MKSRLPIIRWLVCALVRNVPLVFGLGLCLVLAAGCANFRTLTDAERKQKLSRGEILTYLKRVDGTKLSIGESQAIVDAPPARVWNAVTDYNRQSEIAPRAKKIQITRIEGDVTWVDLVLDAPWPMDDAAFTLKVKHDRKNLRTNWTLVEGNIKESYGSWDVDPIPGVPNRSMVTYTLLYDDGRPIPKFIVNGVTRSAVKDVIRVLRAHVNDARYDRPVYSISVVDSGGENISPSATSGTSTETRPHEDFQLDEETQENLR